MTITKRFSQTTEIWLQKNGYSVENLDQQGDNGATALILASREGVIDIDIVRDLLGNHLNLIQLLINAGINLDNQNDNGVTVLMYAASSGKAEAVKLLLAAGANPHLRNLDDFRAIEFSSTVEIINLLRSVTNEQ